METCYKYILERFCTPSVKTADECFSNCQEQFIDYLIGYEKILNQQGNFSSL